MMTISDEGIELIKAFEGCKLFAYRDSVGVATIGYGHTRGVKMGQAITQQQAEQYLREDLLPCEKILNACGVNFRQEQFDALCSWVFNLGITNFRNSTMLKYIMASKEDTDITAKLVRWHNAGGVPMKGLKRRRIAEANLFLGKDVYFLDKDENICKR